MRAQRLLEDQRVARLLAALRATGGETRIVGGAVRDSLLGLAPHEIDLATDALPEAVMQAARKAGLKAVPTGIDHGTVTIVVDGTPFEVTTLREDVETFGRAARVRFGADFEKDALRRDFTVNALSLSPDGRLHDYTGGLADIAARKIRFIGDPARRIAEDHLRILRFFRFHAAVGEGPLDAAGLHAAIVARDSLARLSRERLRAEMLKLFAAKRAIEVAREMSQAGVIEVILGVGFPARLERLAAIEAAGRRSPDPLLRLAAFSLKTVEDAERLRARLRLSNAEFMRLSRAAALMQGLHGLETPPGEQALLRLLYRHGGETVRDALALTHAESRAEAENSAWSAAERFVAGTPAPVFPIKGADLLALGIAPGKAMGAALKRLETEWIRAGFPQDDEAIARLLQEAGPRPQE